jgi:RND family efflux transporter MFP subunit
VRGADKKPRGGWLFLWNDTPRDREETQRLLRVAEPILAGQLALWSSSKGLPGIGKAKRLWRKATASQRTAILTAAGVLTAILLAPVPMPVSAPCLLEPEIRRTVSAPFDGVLRHVSVQPGQTVEAGQLLAEFDDQEIRWELAEVAAKRARAEKQADSAESQGQIAEARMARLDAAGFQETAKVLEHRQAYLQVKAPIAGRVLQGDLEGSIGSRMRMGDRLFEIGPLNFLRAEIAVPEAEIGLVREGATVSLRFEALAGKNWDAKVAMVSPRSELRDGANVFICEAVIENPGQVLRPGSEGHAKVNGPWRPVIWTMARPAWHWVRMKLW